MAKFKPGSCSEADYQYATDNYEGWCLNCQSFTRDACEPDARKYPCPECDLRTVYGAEEALMMGAIELTEED